MNWGDCLYSAEEVEKQLRKAHGMEGFLKGALPDGLGIDPKYLFGVSFFPPRVKEPTFPRTPIFTFAFDHKKRGWTQVDSPGQYLLHTLHPQLTVHRSLKDTRALETAIVVVSDTAINRVTLLLTQEYVTQALPRPFDSGWKEKPETRVFTYAMAQVTVHEMDPLEMLAEVKS